MRGRGDDDGGLTGNKSIPDKISNDSIERLLVS